MANIELLPICSSRFTFGRPSEIAQCLNAWLNQLLLGGASGAASIASVGSNSNGNAGGRARLVDQSSLSLAHLLPERKLLPVDDDDERSNDEPQYADADDDEAPMSWYLYVDLYCLNHNGNLFDASLIALIAALKNGKIYFEYFDFLNK